MNSIYTFRYNNYLAKFAQARLGSKSSSFPRLCLFLSLKELLQLEKYIVQIQVNSIQIHLNSEVISFEVLLCFYLQCSKKLLESNHLHTIQPGNLGYIPLNLGEEVQTNRNSYIQFKVTIS